MGLQGGVQLWGLGVREWMTPELGVEGSQISVASGREEGGRQKHTQRHGNGGEMGARGEFSGAYSCQVQTVFVAAGVVARGEGTGEVSGGQSLTTPMPPLPRPEWCFLQSR